MYISQLIGERTKDTPSDANSANHALLLRAGYIKQVTSGIFTLLPPARKVMRKIEQIIREEMDAVDGQEVTMPVVMPRELWEESGRYNSIGEEMARFIDRNGRDMLLGMTHEEAAVHLARNTVSSYNQLPVMLYQFQTKFRDEARPRGGLIRVREFTMKDAYSFHAGKKDLEKYYDRVHEAYIKIFKRIGMKNFISVKSDTGMMGGAVAHEFMLLSPIGEDTLVICPECAYSSNMEIADGNIPKFEHKDQEKKEVYTSQAKEIKEVASLLNVPAHNTIKAVSFAIKGTQNIAVVFLRGDLEVNEAKLRRAVGANIAAYSIDGAEGLIAGNIGPIGLNLKNAKIIYDRSIENEVGMVVGANKHEYHITGVNVARDIKITKFDDIAKVPEGATCVHCGAKLTLQRGIEVGNIFQLGTKYTESMNMTVLDKNGKSINPIMGCYGIGVGRALGAIVEESHDDKGMILPVNIAPWQVIITALRTDDKEVAAATKKLYASLNKKGIEVIVDDRDASPGVKFNDAELMGIPVRVVVSPRNLANSELELVTRDGSIKKNIPIADAVKEIAAVIAELAGRE